MTDKKLKPCPFCGGEARIKNFYGNRFVQCEDCRTTTSVYSKKEKAIAVWNTRTNTIPVGNGQDYEVVRNE